MRRLAAILLLVTLAWALGGSTAGAERRHRVRLPEPQLPSGLTVDESEWALRPSKTVVAAGTVRLRVYNRGEDDHNLVVHEKNGTPHIVSLRPSEAGTISVAPDPRHVHARLQSLRRHARLARGARDEDDADRALSTAAASGQAATSRKIGIARGARAR